MARARTYNLHGLLVMTADMCLRAFIAASSCLLTWVVQVTLPQDHSPDGKEAKKPCRLVFAPLSPCAATHNPPLWFPSFLINVSESCPEQVRTNTFWTLATSCMTDTCCLKPWSLSEAIILCIQGNRPNTNKCRLHSRFAPRLENNLQHGHLMVYPSCYFTGPKQVTAKGEGVHKAI